MKPLTSLTDSELVQRLPALVQAERHAMADVIEHLVEVERRRLYLREACSCLYRYCIDRLGYSEDAALNRHRVAQLALRVPQVLEELRAGTMHLTGLFLLSSHLSAENAADLLGEARGKSRRDLQRLIAERFPRPEVPPSLAPTLLATCTDTGNGAPAHLEPLSPARLRVEFTAAGEVYEKIQIARELLSHALPSGDLGELFERALDSLIEQETRKRFGAGKDRKRRSLTPGSRHVPVEIVRAVWERDASQCTFVGNEGHRCGERRFLTIEHRTPFALGGTATLENLCLLCSAHNQASARQVFGTTHIETKIDERRRAAAGGETHPPTKEPAPTVSAQVLASLRTLGFGPSAAAAAIGDVLGDEPGLDVEQLLRKCLLLLVPKAS